MGVNILFETDVTFMGPLLDTSIRAFSRNHFDFTNLSIAELLFLNTAYDK